MEAKMKKSKGKKEFVLFRLPHDMDIAELNNAKLDLTDLKLTCINNQLSVVPDLHTDPDRASACPLIPDESNPEKLKCGKPFSAYIQVIKGSKTKSGTKHAEKVVHVSETAPIRVKSESQKKSKRVKVEQ